MTQEPHPGTRLRDRMRESVVAAPGAFNGLCAMAVRDVGFDAAYVSGGATSVAAGVPDVGLLTLDHFAKVIREVVDGTRPHGGSGPALPVIADADTGFGESEMARRTVVEYHRAGAAGLHLEDQVFPKRCGHLGGKTLVALDHFCEKIRGAKEAAVSCSGDDGFIVCARTDARSTDGLATAIERSRAYVDAGADMLFPEGLASEAEFREFAGAFKDGPFLLANMTEFGKTPMIDLQGFGEMGYHLVIYPVSTLRITMHAVTEGLAALKRDGSMESMLDRMQSRDELYGMVGYTPGTEWPFPTG